ncbi:MAG: SCO family protein [Pseudomonadota bacterium]
MRLLALLLLLAVLSGGPVLAFDPFRSTGIDRRPDARAPLDVAVVDEQGTSTTLQALARGKPVLLAPVLHRCPNICGLTLAGLTSAVMAQKFRPGRDFTLIAFGIDPREGTGEAVQSLVELRRAFPDLGSDGVHAVTASPADIARVTGALGYRYAWDEGIGQYAHISAVAVLTPAGHLSRWLYGIAPAATDVRLALTEAGDNRTGDWTDQLLLLCYHYDPETGRYASLVWLLLRIGGGATAVGGSVLIGIAVLRERRGGRGKVP